jgi:hypothetical protein
VSVNGQPLITVEGANNTLEYWSVDWAGNEELPHKILTGIKLDKTKPSSVIALEGMVGENNWFISNVTVALTAEDSLSGVNSTFYSFDNIKWEKYVAPFIVSNEGIVSIYFKSVDKAGNIESLKTEVVKIDKTPPTILAIERQPKEDIQPMQAVNILVNITDLVSGIRNVTLSYNINNGPTWTNITMTPNTTTGLYEATIQGQEPNTLVKYKIIAYDNAGNQVVEDNSGQYYTYTVIPEFSSTIILTIFMLTTTILVILTRYRRLKHRK